MIDRPARATRLATVVLTLGLMAGLVAMTPAASGSSGSRQAPASTSRVLPVTWSKLKVVAGDRVTATVRPAQRPQGSKLVLQRRLLDGWSTEDRTASRGKHGWVLRYEARQYGSFPFRVVAVKRGKAVKVSKAHRVVVSPPYTPVGRRGQFEFLSRPVTRWDSCRPIRWVFNPAHAPQGGLRLIKQGVARIEAATGLDFRYAGRTTRAANPYGDGVHGAKIIIGWRPGSYEFFASSPGVVGVGGNTYLNGFREADRTRVSKAIRGGLVLNADWNDRLGWGFGEGHTWGEVVIHELGHVVGMGHVDADTQIMYYSTTERDATWGAGDLTGLTRLGDTRGCVVRAPGRTMTTPQRQAYP